MKFNKKSFKKKLDTLWSLVIRTRDKKCVICGSRENLQAHHCIVRKAMGNATRWDTRNGICLCYRCHIIELHGYATETVLRKYMNVLDERYTETEREELRKKSKQVLKDDQTTLEEIKKDLELQLSLLEIPD